MNNILKLENLEEMRSKTYLICPDCGEKATLYGYCGKHIKKIFE